jgi:hypothetical protein
MSSSNNKIVNQPATDSIDKLIFEDGLRIKEVYLNRELDLIIVLLNNKKLLKRPISDFEAFPKASANQLGYFENDGIGIYWPELDADLSLRGFLKYELSRIDKPLLA